MLPASYFDELMSEQVPAPKPDPFAEWKRKTHFNGFEATLASPESHSLARQYQDFVELEKRIRQAYVNHVGVDLGDPKGSKTVRYVGASELPPNCRCVVNLPVLYSMTISPTNSKRHFEITITEQGKTTRQHSRQVSAELLSEAISHLLELTDNLTKFVW